MIDEATLIDRLVADHRPAVPNAVQRKLLVAVGIGVVATLLAVLATGLRGDMGVAVTTPIFWFKLGYGGSFAMTAVIALATLFRPGTETPQRLALIFIPLAVAITLGAVELFGEDGPTQSALWLGQSALACPLLIFGLSMPPAIALIIAARRLAPTQLRLTGAVIGLASGGIAALLYALHCPESGYSFVATWYSLGIFAAVAVGYLIGPAVLRWK